jgi:tripartite-type tricarboxylate transporter receptor subunit TctC
MSQRIITLIGTSLLLFFNLGPAAIAGEFPEKPIRMVIGFPPGGGNDIVGRFVAQRLSIELGQQVIVDNRPGAAGDIGAEIVAKSSSDGYTILLIPNTSVISVAMTKRPLKYDIMKDFIPIGLISIAPMVAVVPIQSEITSFRQLITFAKANPGKINHGTAGLGTLAYLAGEWLKSISQIDIVPVPYKGTGPALTGLLSGETQFMFTPLSGVDGFVKEKRLRLIANMGNKRIPSYPEVPTVMESGVAGFDVSLWYGLLAPTGTPLPIVLKFETALKNILTETTAIKELEARGAPAVYGSSGEFGKLMSNDLARWREINKSVKVTMD